LRPVTVLDVGTGTTALPALLASCGCVVSAIDNIRDYWPNGMVNRHWHVQNDDITNPTTRKTFDLITCISVIEHIENDARAFQSLIGLLNPGGHLILTMPYNERIAVPNVYDLPDTTYAAKVPYICRSVSRNELDNWLKMAGAEIVRQEFWEVCSGSVWGQGTALPVPRQVGAADSHQLTCALIRKPQ
jgi:2-polyprenyl-3-methyl-5-hydroxy-6-metoxy-1,4-benzoquinol methylase